jgi:protein SCO1/2
MKSALRPLIVFFGVLLAMVMTYYFVFVAPTNAAPPPMLGQIEDFSLTNTENQDFSKSELNGKVWVADLIFTSCKMTCPMMTKRMKNIFLSYKLEDDVRFVSVSVDPDHDTPKVLKDYTAAQGIDTNRWFFLTGDIAKIRDIAVKSFKLVAVDDPGLHSDKFVLVDRNSKVRGYYDPKDKSELRKLFNDLALVLKEKQGA